MAESSRPRRSSLRMPRFDRAFLNIPAGGTLLDVGCWTCESLLPYRILRPDVAFSGVDRFDCSETPPEPLVDYAQVDLERETMPFSPESFDLIRIAHVFEHLNDPGSLVSQLRPLLRPGGTVFVTSPNERSILLPSFNVAQKQGGSFNFFDDAEHKRPLTSHSLYRWLVQAGFSDEEISVGIERTAWQLVRSVPYTVIYTVARNRARLHGHVQNLVGWTTYGTATRSAEPGTGSG